LIRLLSFFGITAKQNTYEAMKREYGENGLQSYTEAGFDLQDHSIKKDKGKMKIRIKAYYGSNHHRISSKLAKRVIYEILSKVEEYHYPEGKVQA
jgi:hypothetical protein